MSYTPEHELFQYEWEIDQNTEILMEKYSAKSEEELLEMVLSSNVSHLGSNLYHTIPHDELKVAIDICFRKGRRYQELLGPAIHIEYIDKNPSLRKEIPAKDWEKAYC
jgi:hypothetical protein